ncbi:MAG: C39 family peptidase [Candidatus Jordarchaeaceae archaeon]
MSKRLLRTVILLLIIIVLTSPFLVEAMIVTNRVPGVQPGDWAKYHVSFNYTTNDPSPPIFPPQTGEVEYYKTWVESVSGTAITYRYIAHYYSGMDVVTVVTTDVSFGQPPSLFYIAANLTAGDKLYDDPSSPIINATLMRTYAGDERETNYCYLYIEELSRSFHGTHIIELYWERSTGILEEAIHTVRYEKVPEGFVTILEADLLVVQIGWESIPPPSPPPPTPPPPSPPHIPDEYYIPVPHHYQISGFTCGPAALEMVFDHYGEDVSQLEIADVARTRTDGTYTPDMIRAAHFSNLSISPGRLKINGYSARKLGYAAHEFWGLTIDDLKSLIAAGYPVIVLTTWHFRVAVGYNQTHIIFQDSYYGPLTNMTYNDFSLDWDYSGHWALLVCPWKVEISNVKNVLPGTTFEVHAVITYSWIPPFPRGRFPASKVNATISLPEGINLASGETFKKNVGCLAEGESANVSWMVQAQNLGNHVFSVEAEGLIEGFVPPLPQNRSEYFYIDRIGGSGRGWVSVTSLLDEIAPITIDDYDGLWHASDFTIHLTSSDDNSGVLETYYRINNGPIKILSIDGQPLIKSQSANNTLEYWSVDWAGNEEIPHKFLSRIKLDKSGPMIDKPSCIPAGDVYAGQSVKVSVSIYDPLSGVKNATLFYCVNGAPWTSLSMDYNPSTGTYEATIPGQTSLPLPRKSTVQFKIVAYDNVGYVSVEDNLKRYYSYSVSILGGDVDLNRKVDLTDLVLITQAYGSKPDDPNWNPNADADKDGKVGLTDLVTCACYYGQTYP